MLQNEVILSSQYPSVSQYSAQIIVFYFDTNQTTPRLSLFRYLLHDESLLPSIHPFSYHFNSFPFFLVCFYFVIVKRESTPKNTTQMETSK